MSGKFDAATAKPFSRWMTREGEVFTFGMFNPVADEEHVAVGWDSSGNARSYTRDGRYRDGELGLGPVAQMDIVGPEGG